MRLKDLFLNIAQDAKKENNLTLKIVVGIRDKARGPAKTVW
jgi:hypothetical protein